MKQRELHAHGAPNFNSNTIGIMGRTASLVTILVVAMFRVSSGSVEAGWEVVRPLSKSIFQLKSAEKSPVGDCFRFNAVIEAPRNTTTINQYSKWTIRESTQTPNYELVIYKPSVYCLVNGDKLISGSETISIMWTYPTEENLQTVFPFNNCTVQILRQETDKVVSFKAFMKLCSGNYVFWPEIGVKSRQKWDITSNDRKYFKQEWRKIVSTPGELRGATSVAAHFDKVALRKDNMSLKEFTFRVYQRQADWEVVGVTLKIDLLPVF
ncbi:uncharacterized protein LOC125656847 isoform X1 [Ostrea edulis]|uniref:uncharacterized protein LOC125656847 isoform X1 n=1 Tax=Ostrea edulis TaxID=37623 RepID=UPI0024AE9E44|nr:uncharacterized protein LOC125656847 isoform X1 [Ostrea edulis]